MADTSVNYLGLKLKNPLIASSSGITGKYQGIKRLREAGIGAVVVKSLFEEDIRNMANDSLGALPDGNIYAEGYNYIRESAMMLRPDKHIALIKQCKDEMDIPIIASLNCSTPGWWVEYLHKFEQAGADAVELNIAVMPSSPRQSSAELEKQMIKTVKEARKAVSLPLSVKIGMYFTSLPSIALQLQKAGADGIVLFNRFYRPDIDLDKLELVCGNRFTSPGNFLTTLRWLAILSDMVDCDFASGTGVHGSSEVIKSILSGANVAEICSTLYLNKIDVVPKILEEMEQWMEKKGFGSISDFFSLLSFNDDTEKAHFQRLQYIETVRGN